MFYNMSLKGRQHSDKVPPNDWLADDKNGRNRLHLLVTDFTLFSFYITSVALVATAIVNIIKQFPL